MDENKVVLYDVTYKNEPSVYGIDEDYTDGHPMLNDLLDRITGVDGVNLTAYKAKIAELANDPFAGFGSKKTPGKIGSVFGLLCQAYRELK